jgi:hypothetical protein
LLPEFQDELRNGTESTMTRDSKGRFKTGNIGGPGRPRGSRNLLSEEFLADVYEDWTKYGRDVLSRVRTKSPGIYLRCVASLVPKDLIVQRAPSEFDQYSDLELVKMLHDEARSLLEDLED